MNILVTGGTGFTGSNLCGQLVREGHQLKSIVRNPKNAGHLLELGVEVIPGDVCKFETLLAATDHVDAVYHLAALYRKEGVPKKEFWDVNAVGTENLLKASVRQGVRRFIHCSTVGVHGNIHSPPAKEDAPYGPGDPYQESKMEGEKIAIRYMQRGEIGVTIFRPAAIYGPGDLRFLKLFRAIQKRRFIMLGKGQVTYHLIYIDDLVEGIIRCGRENHTVNQIYILGGEEYVTLKHFVTMIADELSVPRPRMHFPVWPVYAAGLACELLFKPLGLEPPLYRRRIDFFKKNRAFDISKSKRELGFMPKIDLREGIRRTARWYAENGYL